MLDFGEYLQKLVGACKDAFGDRLAYAGLQGSYMRNEATDKSDIDVMIILEDFSVADMDVYRDILKKIGHYEKSCGFICGKDEMLKWNPLEVCQLRHTTRDLFGELKDLLRDLYRAGGKAGYNREQRRQCALHHVKPHVRISRRRLSIEYYSGNHGFSFSLDHLVCILTQRRHLGETNQTRMKIQSKRHATPTTLVWPAHDRSMFTGSTYIQDDFSRRASRHETRPDRQAARLLRRADD